MEQFVVRSAVASSDRPTLKFLGDHRAPGFPGVLAILEGRLSGFRTSGSWPAPDDFLWTCSYDGGSFELSDDWGGLFILPLSAAERVLDEVSEALVASGSFERTTEND
ncbi:hypothetical protein DVT68_19930 [Dyella solisilvae]|uniref:DUF3630 family protein n=1 Tax=Dyella solisilvae TaxID=1920168 RepID=A0A370K2D5_9GAMM|nr:hypothetical protein DVT68_19930 [Dyella solisilvae]